MLSIEDTFILVEERLPILGLKLASGVPSDVRGISDVDISLVHPEPQNLLHLMPEGTLQKKRKNLPYPAWGYQFILANRQINLTASTSIKVYDAVKHRELELELIRSYPSLQQSVIEIKKNTTWGTEKCWCHLLGLEGNEYEIMLNQDLVLATGKKKVIS
ncbi:MULTISPECIES: DUF4269 domain-containing protein [Oscillatoriales]|uniref:Uncharacterized protein n=1 Tax=Limnoraphis robusta CS-951 TaxID=1637645 RepID=A0A0F5YBY5_9CYAN|nr:MULTISPECIES: DUF4269 domain-containing protein [Oscillatoriales]EAW33417.1 DNA polymerase I [Lyngbya sp. PCC 8106]KKD36421.1 hypothetical protein WN50_19875 [Limnoraphis robusta CS-951]